MSILSAPVLSLALKQWPVISERGSPPADAKEWEGKPGKLELLER